MAHAFDYPTLVKRNLGYISNDVQQKIAGTTLLIAGCGMGSAPAICAARTGFTKFILADGDVVDAHNLNRQFYTHADIGVAIIRVDRFGELGHVGIGRPAERLVFRGERPRPR